MTLTLRTGLLSLHVASGLLGLLAGVSAFRLPETKEFRSWVGRAYAATLWSKTRPAP